MFLIVGDVLLLAVLPCLPRRGHLRPERPLAQVAHQLRRAGQHPGRADLLRHLVGRVHRAGVQQGRPQEQAAAAGVALPGVLRGAHDFPAAAGVSQEDGGQVSQLISKQAQTECDAFLTALIGTYEKQIFCSFHCIGINI